MMRKRLMSMIVAATVFSGALGELSGTAVAARPHGRATVTVSQHRAPHRPIARPHGRRVIHYPWRHRFVRLGPPCRRKVVVHHPVPQRVVVHPLPPVTVTVPTVRIEPATVTVWVTNSNGSRISVQLTRQGHWYVGPRGEVYAHLPTNEQLRVVYGF